ncbi:hypothetical protein ETR_15951 [Erwinia tracheiphila PSU-1]|nr:hypothetical protein ETR_15951 [Erwinia tracheiphila PSU-1]
MRSTWLVSGDAIIWKCIAMNIESRQICFMLVKITMNRHIILLKSWIGNFCQRMFLQMILTFISDNNLCITP